MVAEVFTDGSCVALLTNQTTGARGYGGWCAVVEHGHEGWVLRGRESWTTAVRMELMAVAEGLASLPAGIDVRLWFDCTVVLSVHDRMQRGLELAGRDGPWWRRVAAQLERLNVELRLLEKRERVPQHQRAHTFAGAEARALRAERVAA